MYTHKRTILDKRRPKKDGLYPVKIRVTFQQLQRYFPVGVDLTQDDFDRITNHSVKKDLRAAKQKIRLMETKISKAIDSIKEFSFEELLIALDRNYTKRNTSSEVYDLFDVVITKLNTEDEAARQVDEEMQQKMGGMAGALGGGLPGF